MEFSQTIGNIGGALARAQAQMGNATKDAQNPHLKNKYASLAAVREACIGPFSANEIAVTQFVDDSEPGKVRVTTQLTHSSGEWMRCSLSAAYGGNRGVTEIQAMGLIVTYLRRYTLAAMAGITQEDDDGASGAKPRVQDDSRPAAPVDPAVRVLIDWCGAQGIDVHPDRAAQVFEVANESRVKQDKPAYTPDSLRSSLNVPAFADWVIRKVTGVK